MVKKLVPKRETQNLALRGDENAYAQFKQIAEQHLRDGVTQYRASWIVTRDMGMGHRFVRTYAERLIAEDPRFADFFKLKKSTE